MTWLSEHRDVLAGVGLIALGAFVLTAVSSFPYGELPMNDPALLPRVIAVALISVGVTVGFLSLTQRKATAGRTAPLAEEAAEEGPDWTTALLLGGAIVAYCLTAFTIGFITITVVFVIVVSILLGQPRSIRGLITLAVFTVVVTGAYYVGFFHLLNVRLPSTPLP